jgi:hypothetical protein
MFERGFVLGLRTGPAQQAFSPLFFFLRIQVYSSLRLSHSLKRSLYSLLHVCTPRQFPTLSHLRGFTVPSTRPAPPHSHDHHPPRPYLVRRRAPLCLSWRRSLRHHHPSAIRTRSSLADDTTIGSCATTVASFLLRWAMAGSDAVFQMYVSIIFLDVALAIYACCKRMFQVFSSVSDVRFKCFI